MVRLIEALMLCYVFSQKSQNKKEVLEHFGHLLSKLTLPYQVLVCKKRISSFRYFSSGIQSRHFGTKSTWELAALVLLPLLQFWRCAPEDDLLVQDQFDGGKDVEGFIHHSGLFYVLKIIKIELTSHFGIEKWPGIMLRTTWELVVRMVLWFNSGFIDVFHDRSLLEGINYDSILVIVGLRDQPVQIQINALGLAKVFILSDLIIIDQNSVSTSKSWSSDTTFKRNCGYHLRVFHKRDHQLEILWLHAEKISSACLWHSKSFSAGPMGLHAWIYLLIVDISWVWQILFRQSFGVTCIDLAINRRLWYPHLHTMTHWRHGKSLSVGPGEVSSMDLAIS